MRTVLILFLLTTLFSTASIAQTLTATEIPVKVRDANKKKFPAVKDAKWKKSGEAFESNQVVNKKQIMVRYDSAGKIITTETEVKLAEVPKPMTDFIVSNMRGKIPSNLRRISDNAGLLTFAAEVDHMRYIFDDKGNFLRQLQEHEY